MADRIAAGECILRKCTINGIPTTENGQVNFHVSQIKIMEDHCKPYFTAQLTLESYNHSHDFFIFTTAEVLIEFVSPSSDPTFPAEVYSERFRIFSHDSEPMREGQSQNRIQHKLSLMGQEYYNDRHNVVNQMDSNLTGTAAAQKIHNNYVEAQNGPIRVSTPSSGMIGSTKHPHQSSNLKPFTAINDILSRCVWQQYPSCAPVHFRDKIGHRIGPLQHIMSSGSSKMTFVETPGSGARNGEMIGTAKGYKQLIAVKPLSPSGEASSGVRASDVGNLNKAASWIDLLSGTFKHGDGKIDSIMKKMGLSSTIPGLNGKIKAMLAESQKGRNGGQLLNFIDSVIQPRSQAKDGPGNFNTSQEAFVTALTYSDKFWITVPGQSGHKITCGDAINIEYSIMRNKRAEDRTRRLYVARLVHTIDFTVGEKRTHQGNKAMTDIYGVAWG